MKLNNLIKLNKKKLRPGRGLGSGKGKTSGRGHKGQKSRSGVAIKSFEGGQMPLFRRLPKRGFKSFKRNNVAIINLSKIQSLFETKKNNLDKNIDLKILQNLKIISKKFDKLKILGTGEIKSKINLSTNYISKQAKEKIEKVGGKLTMLKN